MNFLSLATTTWNFEDIFKSKFADSVTSFSLLDTVIGLCLALVIGLLIFMVYRKTFSGVMYSESFGTSLIGLTMVTTLIILAVTSNVVLSLGMVGALSIVRFRTAIKEPLDIVFLFWSVGVGIVIGAGMIPLAVLGSIVISAVLLVFVNKKSVDTPYILVINCLDEDAEEEAVQEISTSVKKHVIKSKSVSKSGIELTFEIRLNDMATDFVNRLTKIDNVENAVLVSYNGDYMS